jgi:hypothetical protein
MHGRETGSGGKTDWETTPGCCCRGTVRLVEPGPWPWDTLYLMIQQSPGHGEDSNTRHFDLPRDLAVLVSQVVCSMSTFRRLPLIVAPWPLPQSEAAALSPRPATSIHDLPTKSSLRSKRTESEHASWRQSDPAAASYELCVSVQCSGIYLFGLCPMEETQARFGGHFRVQLLLPIPLPICIHSKIRGRLPSLPSSPPTLWASGRSAPRHSLSTRARFSPTSCVLGLGTGIDIGLGMLGPRNQNCQYSPDWSTRTKNRV